VTWAFDSPANSSSAAPWSWKNTQKETGALYGSPIAAMCRTGRPRCAAATSNSAWFSFRHHRTGFDNRLRAAPNRQDTLSA
jgi:hypothetical protein